MTTERHIDISFLAGGHINQDILITADDLTGAELIRMLKNGEASTTIHEGNDVVRISDWAVIGTVVSTEPELEYRGFQTESNDYELENSLQPFNATRLARSFAFGEIFSDLEDIPLNDIVPILEAAGNECPVGLAIEEGSMDKTGNELLREIELMERGYINIMTIAHNAGKKGQEII